MNTDLMEEVGFDFCHGNFRAHVYGLVECKEANRSLVRFRYWAPDDEAPEVWRIWVDNDKLTFGWPDEAYCVRDLDKTLSNPDVKIHDLTKY